MYAIKAHITEPTTLPCHTVASRRLLHSPFSVLLRRSNGQTAALVLRTVLLGCSASYSQSTSTRLRQESAVRLSVEEVPATPAMASMLMVIHLLQRSVLRRPDTETCAVRSAHASREVLDRSLSCGRSVDAIGAPQQLRCQLPHIGASGAPAASNEACWCATATPTGQSKPTGRETPFFHTVGGAEAILF